MWKTFLACLLCLFFVTACNLPLTQTPVPDTPTVTPTATEGYVPCAYMWASKDLPEITAALQTEIQKIAPDAKARASAYGENCVAADGSATFGAMETDFYVTIPVQDLNDNETLGNLVEQVLQVTDQFPRPRVPGGQDGFVEFTFTTGNDQRIVRVSVPLGKQLREKGLHGAELLAAIENP